ncbi:MAG: hypothetical protein KJO46_01730 [Gammaproteobacteria bacterium]|nr:hypothetical protein [Gammaproteobacteria bacterium]
MTTSLTIEQFESGELTAGQFDHGAHVYIAWLYVDRYDLATAIGRFDAALRRLTNHLGVPEKYHATITWLFLLLINERFLENEVFPEFRSRNPDLFENSGMTMRKYYSDALLSSDTARERFVLPDRLAN